MLRVSDDFHIAVRTSSTPKRLLLRFGDTLITNEDIDSSAKFRFTESFNEDTELTIGSCPSSTIETALANIHGLLSDFEFGKCNASLGIRTRIEYIAPMDANAIAIMRYGTNQPLKFSGHSVVPFLKINGEAPTAQPPFAVYSILTAGNMVHCISEYGEIWSALWMDGEVWNAFISTMWNIKATDIWDTITGVLIPEVELRKWDDISYQWDEKRQEMWNSFVQLPEINAFMTRKLAGWALSRRGLSYDSDILHEFYSNGTVSRYEYAMLGTFLVDTPVKRRVTTISVFAFDQMRLFDTGADAFLDGLTYPITLGDIFKQLCQYVGVQNATISFINSDRVFIQPPVRTEDMTAREVLKWIAEAAGAYARMTRHGEVEIAWFAQVNATLQMRDHSAVNISEFTVARIDKLQIAGSEMDIGAIIGEGTNGYRIMDNPYLYADSDYELRKLGVPIYNRLSEFPEFSPIIVDAECDWSIQAGDVIEVVQHGITYLLPIYRQVITQVNVSARVVYENTGANLRPVMDAVNRREFQQRRAIHELTVNVDGVVSQISDVEGNVNQLIITSQGLSDKVTGIAGDVGELALTSSKFQVEIFDTDGNSRIDQNASRIALVVNPTNNSINAAQIVASINGAGSEVYFKADHIRLEGLVSANGNFHIDAYGNMSANNGEFSGKVTATGGKIGDFDISGGALTSPYMTISPTGSVAFGTSATIKYESNAIQLGASTGIQGYVNVTRDVTIQGGLNVYGSIYLSATAVASLKSLLGL